MYIYIRATSNSTPLVQTALQVFEFSDQLSNTREALKAKNIQSASLQGQVGKLCV